MLLDFCCVAPFSVLSVNQQAVPVRWEQRLATTQPVKMITPAINTFRLTMPGIALPYNNIYSVRKLFTGLALATLKHCTVIRTTASTVTIIPTVI
jgi:hypothetical protein